MAPPHQHPAPSTPLPAFILTSPPFNLFSQPSLSFVLLVPHVGSLSAPETQFSCVHVCIQNRQETSLSEAGSDLSRDPFTSRGLPEQIPPLLCCFSNNDLKLTERKSKQCVWNFTMCCEFLLIRVCTCYCFHLEHCRICHLTLYTCSGEIRPHTCCILSLT